MGSAAAEGLRQDFHHGARITRQNCARGARDWMARGAPARRHPDRPAGGHARHRPGDPRLRPPARPLPPEDVVGGQHASPAAASRSATSELADQRVAGGEGDSGAPRPLRTTPRPVSSASSTGQRPMGCPANSGEGLGERRHEIVSSPVPALAGPGL